MSLAEIERMFSVENDPIPVDLDRDSAKEIVINTCKSALAMDIAQMRRGLEKWGFKLTEYERLSDECDHHVLQEYLVWIDCNYGIELAKSNIENWLVGLADFTWVGRWDFVVKYPRTNFAHGDFTVRVTRWNGHVFSLHNVSIKVHWPNHRQSIIKSSAWQRALIYG